MAGRTLSLRTPTQEIGPIRPLKVGSECLRIAVPEAKSPEIVANPIQAERTACQTDTFQVVPVKKGRSIFLCYSHNASDTTDLQADVERVIYVCIYTSFEQFVDCHSLNITLPELRNKYYELQHGISSRFTIKVEMENQVYC